MALVFPAYAGVSLTTPTPEELDAGLPRLRGGEPNAPTFPEA